MGERRPSQEQPPIPAEAVSAALRDQGQTPEALTMFYAWLQQEYDRVDRRECTDWELAVAQADVLRDGGLVEVARTAYEQAAEYAFDLHEDDLYEYCMQQVDALTKQPGDSK